MTVAYWCLLAALVLPYFFTMYAKVVGRLGARQNHAPREHLEKLSGPAKRAHWAQLNSFEVTPAFAAAVIVAHQLAGAAQSTIDGLAIAFVASRVLYGVLYIADQALMRTLVWTVGMACVVALFVVSA